MRRINPYAIGVLALIIGALLSPAIGGARAGLYTDVWPDRIVAYNGDATRVYLPQGGSTPVVTDTPDAPTHTPVPTNTPRPTVTVSATPDSEATPTPEDARTPTNTPAPTLTPLPSLTPTLVARGCIVETDTYLRVRKMPAGEYLDTLAPGYVLAIDGQYTVTTHSNPSFIGTWYRFYDGWVHGDFVTPQSGADCSVLPVVEPDEPQPPTALLWHAVTNANGAEMLASYGILNAAGIPGGVKPYADTGRCIEALESGNICIYRWPVNGTDCPDMTKHPIGEGARWMRDYDNAVRGALFSYADTGRLWIESVNECDFGGGNTTEDIIKLNWWALWMDDAIDYVEQAGGWPPLVMPTLGPGHGSALMFEMWKPQLERLAAMGGLFGDHAYTPWHDDGLCAFDEWLAARSVTNHEWMVDAGYSIDIAITEASRGWGNDPVDVADFACWYNKISAFEFIRAVAFWTAGHHPTWPNANLNNFMVPIAEAVARR